MTLTFINIDNQHQIKVGIVFKSITKKFRINMESTNDEQISASICTHGSSQYSFIEALFKNPPSVLVKGQDGKSYMENIFLDMNDEIFIIKCLTYNITNKTYKTDTEKIETWEKFIFSCPLKSTIFAFIESFFKKPPPVKIVSMYQTVWITDTSLN